MSIWSASLYWVDPITTNFDLPNKLSTSNHIIVKYDHLYPHFHYHLASSYTGDRKHEMLKLSIILYQILDNVFTNLRLWPSPSTSLSCRVNEPVHTLDAFPVHSVSHWAYGPVPCTRQNVEWIRNRSHHRHLLLERNTGRRWPILTAFEYASKARGREDFDFFFFLNLDSFANYHARV